LKAAGIERATLFDDNAEGGKAAGQRRDGWRQQPGFRRKPQ
jgi:hypothetical protein